MQIAGKARGVIDRHRRVEMHQQRFLLAQEISDRERRRHAHLIRKRRFSLGVRDGGGRRFVSSNEKPVIVGGGTEALKQPADTGDLAR